MAVTGGGASAIAELLAVAGASRTLLEASVPYSSAAMTDCLGHKPEQACSAGTARALAMASFRRCQRLNEDDQPALGLGCTAALATDRPRRGPHHCFVAVQSLQATHEYSLVLAKNTRSRAEEEALCSALVIAAMVQGPGVAPPQLPGLTAHDQLTMRHHLAPSSWQRLFDRQLTSTWTETKAPAVVFPGAFNPLHDGHTQIMTIAADLLAAPVVLEISAFNVDKPPLDYLALAERESACGDARLIFSNAPRFTEKARIYPGATFVVGSDTIARIADPFYYAGSTAQRDAAIRLLAEGEHRFLVFGRSDGRAFIGLQDMTLPRELTDLCRGVPESAFRQDIASRDMRAGE